MFSFRSGFRNTLLLLGCGLSLHAQEKPAPTPDRKATPPSLTASGMRELRDVPYVTNGHERQRLDLFLPTESNSLRPLVVWIHGGGWEGGSKDRCPAMGMLARGYAVASIGYRLSQNAVYPAQIEDCKAAIRWLRVHAKEYAIDPDRVGVWGASAGGHLAALIGTTGNIRTFDVGENLNESSRVQCVIDWFGPTDFLHYGDPAWLQLDQPKSVVSRLLGGTVSSNPEKAKQASPVYFVNAETAPFLIMQGDNDNLVPAQQSELLHQTLQKAGVESQLRIYPGAGHGGQAFSSPESIKLMVEFFEAHLGRKSAAVK